MIQYIARRLVFLLLTLLFTSMVIFAATQILPGDTARAVLGREAGEAALNAYREEHGLNDPLLIQYGRWLFDFVRGDWGISLSVRVPIRPFVLGRLRNSLWLGAATMLFAVPLSLLLGAIAGLNEDKAVDNVISVSSLSVVGLPEFVTGLILIEIFTHRLGWLPANSSIPPNAKLWEIWPMLILPALTATLVLLAYITRLTRAGVVEELKKPYVRTAVLKGISHRRVVVKHVLRNALLPTITVIGISVGWLISGLIVIENVFNYPGLGRLFIFAIDRRDLPLMQAATMVTVVVFALTSLTADLLYAWLNPRIRLN